MTKRKRTKYKRRVLIYTALFSLIVFSIVDYYFETAGVPDFIKEDIRSRFLEYGLDLTFDDAKCGVFNGLVLNNPRCSGGDAGIYPSISAVSMVLRPRLSLSSRYLLAIDSITIHGGHAVFPLFPESGVEGARDVLEFREIEGMLRVDGNALNVAWLTGNLWKLKLSIAGRIDNVFSEKVAVWFSKKKGRNDKRFDTTFLMSAYSYKTRALLWREYKDFREKTRWESAKPICNVSFKLDPLNPKANNLKMDLRVPAMTYASRKIEKGNAIVSLNGDILTLDECFITTPEGDELKIEGRLNTDEGVATGKIVAHLTPDTFRSVSEIKQIGVPKNLNLLSPVSISFDIKEHAIYSKSINASILLKIKRFKFGSALIENIRLVGTVGEDWFSISDSELFIDGIKLKLAATCKPSTKSIDVDAHFFGPPVFISKLLSAKSSKLIKDILNRFTFPKRNTDVDMVVQLHATWDGGIFYVATGNVVMKDFKYYKTAFTSGDASFILDSNGLLFFHNVYLYQKNGWMKTNLMYIYTKGIDYHVESPFFKSSTGPMDEFATDFEGVIAAQDVLNCISPDWSSDIVDLSGLANVKASGVIDFLNMRKTRFDVDVKSSSCVWNKVPITDLEYELRVKNMDMEIKNVKGKVYGGNLTLDYATSFKTGKGRVKLKLVNAAFPPLAEKISWKLPRGEGVISLTTDAKLENDENGRMLVFGKGRAEVRDANLWEVPVLRSFGKAASKWTDGKWGMISALTADFKFEGDHISTENIQTNGKIIALKSKGEYYWRSGNYDFIVNAEVFKTALPYKIIPKLFNPLTKLASKRIVRRDGRTIIKKVKKKNPEKSGRR
ncbi:MAG: hypothetical protein GXP32_01605 [Kiritimatiellaeota bacterium]|nr:hypothetical protein [Kiritimatiellota bacterium]